MIDHKATLEHWAAVEAYAQEVSSTDDCLLELRARVETLEKRCEVQLMQLSDLQDRHHRLTLRVGHLEYELVRDEDDLPRQHCLEAMDPPEANSQPEPQGPTDEELLAVAASTIEPYEGSGIAVGEYEPEYECAVEAYGSELIAYARAVLARYGIPANPTSEKTNGQD
jgi:hypothetical protein